MQIHNHGNDPRLNLRSHQQVRPSADGVDESKVQSSDDVKPSRLLERLEGDARVRERLLVEVQAKFHAGEYLTRTAAEEAAQQIVD